MKNEWRERERLLLMTIADALHRDIARRIDQLDKAPLIIKVRYIGGVGRGNGRGVRRRTRGGLAVVKGDGSNDVR